MNNIAHNLNKIRQISKRVVENESIVEKNMYELQEICGKLALSTDKIKNQLNTPINSVLLHSPQVVGLSSVLQDILKDVHYIQTENQTLFKPVVKKIGKPLDEVITEIRMGNLDELLDNYAHGLEYVTENFNNNHIKNSFRRIMEKTFPDRKLNKILKKDVEQVQKQLPKNIYSKDFNFNKKNGGLDDLYHSDRSFKKLIDNLEKLPKKVNKSTITVKGIFITVTLGLGVYVLLQNLARQAEKIAGCWRIYITHTGEISACKITQCSCANKESNPKNTCTKLLKISNIGSLCSGWPDDKKDIKGSECRKCDVEADVNSLQYLSVNEMINPNDVYICRSKPNLGMMLSEFIVDLPKQIWEGVNTTFDFIITLLIYISVFVLGCILMTIIFKFNNWFNKTQNSNEEGNIQ